MRSVVLDGPDSWAQSLLETKQIDKFVPVDFTDAESAFDRCVAALKKVKTVSADRICLGVLADRQGRWQCALPSLPASR